MFINEDFVKICRCLACSFTKKSIRSRFFPGTLVHTYDLNKPKTSLHFHYIVNKFMDITWEIFAPQSWNFNQTELMVYFSVLCTKSFDGFPGCKTIKQYWFQSIFYHILVHFTPWSLQILSKWLKIFREDVHCWAT